MRLPLVAVLLLVAASSCIPVPLVATNTAPVATSQLSQTKTPATAIATNADSTAQIVGAWHVRDNSGITGKHLAYVDDETVIVLETKNGWTQIETVGGVVGWVNSKAFKK